MKRHKAEELSARAAAIHEDLGVCVYTCEDNETGWPIISRGEMILPTWLTPAALDLFEAFKILSPEKFNELASRSH